MLYLGIDIGITGAVAVLDDQGRFVEVFDMPVCAVRWSAKRKGIHRSVLFEKLVMIKTNNEVRATVEDQAPQPVSGCIQSFSLAQSLERIERTLWDLFIVPSFVKPRVWKKHFGLLKRDKQDSVAMALELFPDAPLFRKKDHNRAEALLIAAYGWQKEQA